MQRLLRPNGTIPSGHMGLEALAEPLHGMGLEALVKPLLLHL